jgi:hypothetical protein
MNCEICNKGNISYPSGFIVNDNWWHICPKCKAKVLVGRFE